MIVLLSIVAVRSLRRSSGGACDRSRERRGYLLARSWSTAGVEDWSGLRRTFRSKTFGVGRRGGGRGEASPCDGDEGRRGGCSPRARPRPPRGGARGRRDGVV